MLDSDKFPADLRLQAEQVERVGQDPPSNSATWPPLPRVPSFAFF